MYNIDTHKVMEYLRELLEGKRQLADAIISYESGDVTDEYVLALFAYLLKTGKVYQLQGAYGRMAHALIRDGILDRQGNILI